MNTDSHHNQKGIWPFPPLLFSDIDVTEKQDGYAIIKRLRETGADLRRCEEEEKTPSAYDQRLFCPNAQCSNAKVEPVRAQDLHS